jgi:serine/threonine protein kinase
MKKSLFLFLIYSNQILAQITETQNYLIEINVINFKYTPRILPSLKWKYNFYLTKFNYQLTNFSKEIIKKQLQETFGIYVIKELGAGNFGTVFKATNFNYKNIPVAIKIYSASTQSNSRYYNVLINKSCCLENLCQPACNQNRDQSLDLPIETTALLLAREIDGIIKVKGMGIIIDAVTKNLAYYITIMEYIDGSITAKDFSKCIRNKLYGDNPKLAFKMMQIILNKLHEINQNLFKIRIFQNDLKSDNILLTYTSDTKSESVNSGGEECNIEISEDGKLNLFLIDFGNAIIERSNMNNEFFVTIENYLPTHNEIVAPELIKFLILFKGIEPVERLFSWYYGALLYELCKKKFIFTDLRISLKTQSEGEKGVPLVPLIVHDPQGFRPSVVQWVQSRPSSRRTYLNAINDIQVQFYLNKKIQHLLIEIEANLRLRIGIESTNKIIFEAFGNFMRNTLQADPNLRISFIKIEEDQFFKMIL